MRTPGREAWTLASLQGATDKTTLMIDDTSGPLLRHPVRRAACAAFGLRGTFADQAMTDLSRLAARSLRTSMAAITLVEDDEQQCSMAQVGLSDEDTFPTGGFSAWIAAHGATLVVPDAAADERADLRAAQMQTGGFYAGAPLLIGDGVALGVLAVFDSATRPAGLSADERETLEMLARQVVAQLELRRFREEAKHAKMEARRQTDALQASEARTRFLLALSASLRPLAEIAEIAETVTRLICEHFHADRAGFAEAEADEEHIITISEWLEPGMPSLLRRLRLSDYGPDIGVRLRAGEPFLLCDAAADPRISGQRETYAAISLRAALVVPLIKRGQLVALLWLNQRTPREWTPEETDLAGVAVNILWEAVERARAEVDRRMLAAVVEQSTDLIAISTPEGRGIFINESGRRLLGFADLEEVRAAHLLDCFPAADRAFVETIIVPTMRREGRWAGEFRLEHRETGTMVPVHYTGFVIRGPQEEIIALATVTRDITEEKRNHDELARLNAESRTRLSEFGTLLNLIPVGICVAMDRDCRSVRLNPALARILGVASLADASLTAPAEERPTDFEVCDDAGRIIPREELPMQVAAREGWETGGVELNIIHTDGRKLRLLEYAAPLFDEAGDPRGAIGAFVDITERQQQEQRQRFLVTLDDAVRPLSDSAEIVAAAARLLGEHLQVDRCAYADMEPDEDTMNITGDYCRGVPSIVGRYTFTQFGEEVLRLMRADEPYVVEDVETHQPAPSDLRAYHATWIRAVICVPLHKGGKFVAAMAVHQTTPRRWTAEEVALTLHVANRCWEALERTRVTRILAESEERFRTLADNIAQLAWMAHADGAIFWYNQRWFDYTGTTLESMQGWGWREVHHPEYLERVTEKWQRHLKAGEGWEDTFPLRSKEGPYRWFLSRAFPIRDAEGKVLRWFGTNTDVTEQREIAEALARAKEEAEQANRSKDDFLAALSHELRTPLTPVLLCAEALQEEKGLPAEVRAQLAMMHRNIEMEARLIDDLLDLTRVSRGKLALRLQNCEAHSLITLALEIVRDEARAKELLLEVFLDAQHTQVRCDPARLQQVFWNLLKNAVKFTPVGGRIIVRSRDLDTGLAVEVSDNGIGIAPDSIDRIFMPFEQAGLTNDHRFGGLGLGLSISKAIVEMHGGTLIVESDGKDRGATFRVQLAASEPAGEVHEGSDSAAPTTPHPHDLPAGPPLRLLLVEDHEPTLAVLARLLTRAGHTVATANSVNAARELAARQQFDGVVSDIGLPDGTGIELMAELRLSQGLRGIALSGYGMEDDQRRTREAGFVAHLVKPVDFVQLRRALAKLHVEEEPAA